MLNLVAGQRAKLADLTPETRARVGVRIDGPSTGDVACVAVLLGDAQEAITPAAVVFSERPRSDCGGVSVSGRSPAEADFDIDLTKLPAEASHVLFAVGLRNGKADSIRHGSWHVTANGREVARYPFTGGDFGDVAAVTVAEFYRKSGEWRLRAIGEGFVGGLPTLLSRYKIVPQTAAPVGPELSSAPAGFVLPKTWAGGLQPTVPRDLTRCVGLIVARGADESVHTGTGFVVSPGGYFITCNHVVENAAHLAICLDGTQLLRAAEVVAQSPEADLALCWIADRNGSPDWLVLAGPEATPSLGDELGLLGYPLGVDLGLSVTYSQGIINSLRSTGDVSVLQIDVGAAPGSSGGPVFRRSDGRVLGVLTSGLDVKNRGMLINFAVDARMIWRLGWVK